MSPLRTQSYSVTVAVTRRRPPSPLSGVTIPIAPAKKKKNKKRAKKGAHDDDCAKPQKKPENRVQAKPHTRTHLDLQDPKKIT